MKVLVATKNNHKLTEIEEILKENNIDIELLSLSHFNDNDEVLETGKTFKENAYIKAKYYFDKFHLPTIGEDSGLEINHFNNYPGIYSARFFGDLPYSLINQNVIEMMNGVSDRSCRFVSTICYIDVNGNANYFEGDIKGTVSEKQKGTNGFGYDPIFFVPEYNKTLAEMGDEKNKISHRYNSLVKWVKSL